MSRPAVAQLRTLILATLEAQGVKQVDLADRIGHSEKHVSQTLTGAAGLSLTLAEKMLAALGMKLTLSIEPVRRFDPPADDTELPWCHCVEAGYPGPHRPAETCEPEAAS